MKKVFLITIYFITFLNFNLSYSQQKKGLVEYEASAYLTGYKIALETNNSLNSKEREYMKNSILASRNLRFELKFNENESSFKCISDLSKKTGAPRSINFTKIKSGAKDDYYSNQKTDEKYRISQHFSKFLIQDKVDKWNITQETKMINDYKCFKATTNRYSYGRNGEIKKPIIAWFTKEIPTSFGIQNLNGLPGLIIELSIYNRVSFKAIKVDLNPKEKIEIIKPKGKKISSEEFAEIISGSLKAKRGI